MHSKLSIKDIEKKIRREIRIKKLIQKNDIILILDQKDSQTQAIYHILKETIKDPSVKIQKVKKIPKLSEKKKLVSTNTIEKESEEYIKEFVDDKTRKEENIIKPLIRIKEEECDFYCERKQIKYEKTKTKISPVREFINRIQNKYSQTFNSVIKTEEQLKK